MSRAAWKPPAHRPEPANAYASDVQLPDRPSPLVSEGAGPVLPAEVTLDAQRAPAVRG